MRGPTRRTLVGLVAALAALTKEQAMAQAPDAAIVEALAPTGRLRAAINLGNPVLARREGDALKGISVDLAGRLAQRVGRPLDLVPYEGAGQVSASAGAGAWDVAFLAVDPKRAEDIGFSAPYLIIEGTYMVAADSPLTAIEDVDRSGVRIAVGQGSAYDLYLTRAIRHATLVRAPTSAEAVAVFARDHLEVAAGVKQPLVRYAAEHPGYRVMPGRFMAIEQAMGVPQGRGPALGYLRSFVEEAKASGFVAEAISRNAQPDALVAPPAG